MTGAHRIVVGSSVAVLCLGVGACSTTMEIAITGPLGSPVITFSGPGGRAERVCLDSVTVYEAGARAPRNTAWRIGDAEAKCVSVESVTYGRAPDGLVTREGPAPLKPNIQYEFSGGGWTRGMPNIPWYGGGPGARVIFRDGAWRSVGS